MKLEGFYTKQGEELAAKFTLGQGLTITRVVAGSGRTEAEASALALPCQTLAVNTASREGNVVTVPVTLAEALAEKDYTLTELGIYAVDPDKGEILYRICRMDTALPIRAGGQSGLRIYIRASASGDPEVEVNCSPDGLITEREFGPVRNVVQSLLVSNHSVTLTAAELAGYINALPRLLTENLTITVSGTLENALSIQNFYGSGSLKIQAETSGDFVMKNRIFIAKNRVPVTISAVSFQPLSNMRQGIVDVTLSDLNLYGCDFSNPNSAEVITAVMSEERANCRVSGCTVSGFYAVLQMYQSGYVAISGAADAFSANTYGIYTYYGGIVQLVGDTPTMLGGTSNRRDGGGAIINAAGQLI